MEIARSTYYETPVSTPNDTAIFEAIGTICDEFEHYGWRRVRAALRQQGMVVNHKKIRRLMREHDLQPRMRRRFVATTDSDHDEPIFSNRAKDIIVDGPNQLWVADITYAAILTSFVYVAVILDAWSRRVVGYAISRSIDARLTVAAPASHLSSRHGHIRSVLDSTAPPSQGGRVRFHLIMSHLDGIAFTPKRAEGGHMWIENIVHDACPICGKVTTLVRPGGPARVSSRLVRSPRSLLVMVEVKPT